MQGLQESENEAILEYITNQRLAENHCALSAEISGVRERIRRVWLNWTVHVPVSRSLQGNGAEKRDGGRLEEGDEKRWWEDNEGMYCRRCPQKDDERYLKEDQDEEMLTILIKGTVGGS